MVHVELSLHLPRDAASVPAVRRICRHTLESLDVPPDECADVLLALSEACGNVIRHAPSDRDYAVTMRLNGTECTIVVTDSGPSPYMRDGLPAIEDHTAETGRGIALMSALVDVLAFRPAPGGTGTAVELVRQLTVPDGSLLAVLA